MRHCSKSIWNDIFSQPGFVAFAEGEGKRLCRRFLLQRLYCNFGQLNSVCGQFKRGVMYLFLVGQKQLLPQASGKPERPFQMRLIHFLPCVVITIIISIKIAIVEYCTFQYNFATFSFEQKHKREYVPVKGEFPVKT